MNDLRSKVDSRFLQANERTLLAWLRTALGLMGFGFVLAKSGQLLQVSEPAVGSEQLNRWLGTGFVLGGAMTIATSLVRFLRMHRSIIAGDPTDTGVAAPVSLSVLAIGLALAMAAWMLLH